MNSDEIHYHLTGLPGLKELLEVITEIKSETGMIPDVIKYRDGYQLTYNQEDALALIDEKIDEQEYITRNSLLQTAK